MRLKLFTVITIATIGQLTTMDSANAESVQIGRLVSQNSLAQSIDISNNSADRSSKLVTAPRDILTASEQIALAKRKRTIRKKPIAKPVVAPKPASPSVPATQSQTPDANQKQVLVSDIVIQNPKGVLTPELEAKVRETLTVKTGQPTTRDQLEQNLNAIRALGAFSAVEIVPQDTPKGVKLSFLVTPYGVVNQVQIKTLPANSSSILNQADVDKLFQPQYGKPLNAAELKAAIGQLNQLYQQRGYNLAQVVNVEELGADGKLNIVVAEGLIEDVQVRFINKAGSLLDDKKQPITGVTRPFIVTREAQLKPGSIFNRATAEKDLRRIYGLGLFDDVRLSFAPGTDPARVIMQLNVIERKTSSIIAGGGISSTNGLFASLGYTQNNVGGNAQKFGADIQLGTLGTLYNVNFTDPWIATDPNRTSYNVSLFSQRSTSLVFGGGKIAQYVPNTTDTPIIGRQGVGLTFTRPLNGDPFRDDGWRASAGFQYQRVSITDSVNPNQIVPVDTAGNQLSFSGTGQDDLLFAQLGLSRDERNNPTDPTQGSLLKLGLDQTVPIGQGSILFTRVRGSYTHYIPVNLLSFTPGSQALLFNVQGGTILGNLPPYEAFSLGGNTSVRGFNDGDVGSGRSYAQATAEYRFPIFSIVGGEFFVDYGTDLGTSTPTAITRGKPGSGLGYGFGVRISSPIGSIRVDYGLNNQGGSVVNFGIGERF